MASGVESIPVGGRGNSEAKTMKPTSYPLSEFVELPSVGYGKVYLRFLGKREWGVQAGSAGLVVRSAYSRWEDQDAGKRLRAVTDSGEHDKTPAQHLISHPWGPVASPEVSIDAAQHLVGGPNGWLAGYDAGEWDGGLVEFDKAENIVKQHLSTAVGEFGNVLGIYVNRDAVVVLRGCAHVSPFTGAIEVYRGEVGTGLELQRSVRLPDTPEVGGISDAGTLWIAIWQGLLKFNIDDASMKLFAPCLPQLNNPMREVSLDWTPHRSTGHSAWAFGRPNSIACVGEEIYVGCGSMIVRLAPSAGGLHETRLIHRDDLAQIERRERSA